MTKDRLNELAMRFADGLLEDSRENAIEYFISVCDMSEKELKYFGIELTKEERKEWAFLLDSR